MRILTAPFIALAQVGGWWRARLDDRTARERAFDAAVIARIAKGEWTTDPKHPERKPHD